MPFSATQTIVFHSSSRPKPTFIPRPRGNPEPPPRPLREIHWLYLVETYNHGNSVRRSSSLSPWRRVGFKLVWASEKRVYLCFKWGVFYRAYHDYGCATRDWTTGWLRAGKWSVVTRHWLGIGKVDATGMASEGV